MLVTTGVAGLAGCFGVVKRMGHGHHEGIAAAASHRTDGSKNGRGDVEEKEVWEKRLSMVFDCFSTHQESAGRERERAPPGQRQGKGHSEKLMSRKQLLEVPPTALSFLHPRTCTHTTHALRTRTQLVVSKACHTPNSTRV